MYKTVTRTFKTGLRQFVDHPQLWLTVLVALSIVLSFLFIANQFITVAKDAQERLINVRVGTLQDTFQPLAEELSSNPERLRAHMKAIALQNPTITRFLIAEKQDSDWVVTLSLDDEEEGGPLVGYGFLLSLAQADPSNSFTREEVEEGERFFLATRGVRGEEGGVRSVVVVRQTLSEADRMIAGHIREGMITLVLILLFLLLLFFRHAHIIDYTVLYKKLKELDTLKDDFISMASHELRTPLTAIRGYTELLEEQGEVVSKDGVEFLRRISHSAEELDQLVADMLDVSRIEQGRLSFEMSIVQLSGVAHTTVETLRFKAEEKSLTIREEYEEEVTALLDEKRFRQILINLIGNSVKYTKEGEIVVRTYKEGARVFLRVSDTGIGLSFDEQKHLFEKFYRSSGEDTQKEVGTGLGLWITKQLVLGMHGAISVESIKGVGTHMIVSFPSTTSKEEGEE